MPPILSMPLFVTPADVITRMQLTESLEGITDVVASGIIGAQLHLQRSVGELVRQSRDLKYFLDSQSFSGIQRDGVYRIELPSSFVRTDTPVTITATAPVSDASNTGLFSTYTAIDEALRHIDYARGYILLDTSYGDCYVRVQCDTGFEDGNTPLPIDDLDPWDIDTAYVIGDLVSHDEVAYEAVQDGTGHDVTDTAYWTPALVPMEQIPADLYEAIMSMVAVIFDASQNTNRESQAVDQYKKAADHAAILLQSYVRAKGFSFRPI